METKITTGEWITVDVGTPNGSFNKVVAMIGDVQGESICNITTRNGERAFENAKLIALAGNLAQQYPPDTWQSKLDENERMREALERIIKFTEQEIYFDDRIGIRQLASQALTNPESDNTPLGINL